MSQEETKKIFEWFVKTSTKEYLQNELNAFSKQGWDIYRLSNKETVLESYWTIIARKEIRGEK